MLKEEAWEPYTLEQLGEKLKDLRNRSFYGKVTLHYHRGEVPRITTERSEIPPQKYKEKEINDDESRGEGNATS